MSQETTYRSHMCSTVTDKMLKSEVRLCGWVDRYRDHGGVVFIDLRDKTGIVQIVFDPGEDACSDEVVQRASELRQEAVIRVHGTVRNRPEGMTNEKIPTGKVEVLCDTLDVLNKAEALPFSLHEDSPSAGEVEETLRLRYRYLELRKPKQQNFLNVRHRMLKAIREFYWNKDFTEIETPILYKSTPEGARDYLVPSRVHPGQFYALPQSPQTLKQLCMIGGFDRYFQIARCFRDEDLRADRQPEFTQLDVELSFVEEGDVLDLHEELIAYVTKEVAGVELSRPFTRLTYADAMGRYGSDKPDLRNTLELTDLTEEGKKCSFKVFQSAVESGGILKGLCFQEKEALTRKDLDALPKEVEAFGARGVSWIRMKGPGDWQGPQAKYFSDDLKSQVEAKLPFKTPCMLLLMCGSSKMVHQSLSHLRGLFGSRLGYVEDRPFDVTWIVDFPLFEYDKEEGRLYAAHHPFTQPSQEDEGTFLETTDVEKLSRVKARAYDLVMNGYEVGGGSIRIHRPEVQAQMFRALGISEEEAKLKFGFFLEALRYGTPPHGGIAFGMDRLAMVYSGTDAIRDVIAFPKTQKAADIMSAAPSEVSSDQLRDLGIKTIEKK